jgi:L-2-hydroxyglutarate oxidase
MNRLHPPPRQADFAVVGGGIVGLAVAREILTRQPDASLALLEAEDRLSAHQTSHSSGVIHAGVYYQPGSLKARLCTEGSAALIAYCESKGIPFDRNGKLVVATESDDLPRLDRLEQRARANGVAGLARVGPDEITSIEPAARGISALHSPNTAVVDFSQVGAALAADIEQFGGSIHLAAPVVEAASDSDGLSIQTGRGALRAERAVFCAGLQADRLAALTGGDPEPRIVPIRGSYLKIRPERAGLVRGNIYPVPDPELPFLGAHLTRGHDGSVLIGPTAMLVGARDGYRLAALRIRDLRETASWPGTWRLIRRFPTATANEILHSISPRLLVREARRLVPALRPADVESGPAGIRAQALGRDGQLIEDFLIERTGPALHVRNAPSPAATSSLALARLIADEIT